MPLSLHWPAAKTRRGRAPLQEDSPAELTELTCGDMALSPSFLGLLVELKSTLIKSFLSRLPRTLDSGARGLAQAPALKGAAARSEPSLQRLISESGLTAGTRHPASFPRLTTEAR